MSVEKEMEEAWNRSGTKKVQSECLLKYNFHLDEDQDEDLFLVQKDSSLACNIYAS